MGVHQLETAFTTTVCKEVARWAPIRAKQRYLASSLSVESKNGPQLIFRDCARSVDLVAKDEDGN